MSTLTLFALALGLAMDATAVAAARGLSAGRVSPRQLLVVAAWFGGAQGIMPMLGATLGQLLGPRLLVYNQWIGAGLLWLVGGKMLLDAYKSDDAGDEAQGPAPFSARAMLPLSLATSLDAFAVGVTLPLLGVPVLQAGLVIGGVTALCGALGLLAGSHFGALFGKRLDLFGGLVLIALGVKVLRGG